MWECPSDRKALWERVSDRKVLWELWEFVSDRKALWEELDLATILLLLLLLDSILPDSRLAEGPPQRREKGSAAWPSRSSVLLLYSVKGR